jgi:Transglycosylase-like domain
MRNRIKIVVTVVLLALQATTSFPGLVAASAQTPKSTDYYSKLEVSLNIKNTNPIVVTAPKTPDFDTDVLVPLQAAQANEAKIAQAAADAARVAAEASQRVSDRIVIISGDAWGLLRACEAGSDYARNSGNGYYGAYQFDIGTWGNFGGFSRPDLAPPAVQDAKAQATQAARGWGPWPACARKIGLL